jgi:hypothetical protein
VKQSPEIAKLAVALVKVQVELRSISKDSTNPHFKNKYASLDVITETVRPLLAKNGLALIQGTSPVSDAEGRLTALTVDSILLHESGEWLSTGIMIPVGTVATKDKAGNVIAAEPTAQTAGGAVTYGRRYGLALLLALTTDEDDDGVQASTRAEAPAKPAPVPAAAPVKAADRRIATPNGDKRLGDYTSEELVKLKDRAEAGGKKALVAAVEEVLMERENAALDQKDDLPF